MSRASFLITTVAIAAAGYGAWRYYGQPDLLAMARGERPQQTQAAQGGAKPAAPQGGPGVAVVTAAAEQLDFPIRRRSIGNIEPNATVVVKSRVDSQLVQQHVKDGQFVKAGDPLFSLDDKELRAAVARDEANIAKDQANLNRAQADLQRKQELMAARSGAQQQVDQAVADAKAAEAQLAADQAALQTDKLRLSYTQITAPIDGRLGAIQVTPGNLVRASDNSNSSNAGLVTITQVKPVKVTFALPERELSAVRDAIAKGAPPTVSVFPSGGKDALASGPVTFVDSGVDVASGTFTVKATFPNEDLKLWPGQYVDVQVELGKRPGSVVVPTVALQAGQNDPYLFVVRPDNTVELRTVKVAMTDGERTAIASGLKAGERVVVDGQLRLANGAKVRDTSAAQARSVPKEPAEAREEAPEAGGSKRS
ncbi:efflux RND transporter periplasmic adaptor subunit [Alsobacter soli]|uniref:Efflux RND transporter periplasmic adaptor subunit n=1 Tax=Alsobacter soli TaxID=2109933 RepID=A0A2T1HQI9_9HYPH|nr:efflux RND transporter periplasmic adaptor subunit [Alsobacter soli]PSC03789.1 efflux RND transporter periplasmic adaptor subunit [Alsobacter soli]